MGTPQGGPLSPLLSNLMLDLLDKELEKRDHRFVRYADDCYVYVRSRQAGVRVMESITRFVETRLKLRINQTKSAVDRPWNRKILGFTFSRGLRLKRLVSAQSLTRFKDRIREFTYRTRGTKLENVVADLRRYLRGWWAYFSFCEGKSIFKQIDSWIRRRLRCYHLKQWGRRGYRELRKRGVSVRLAWNTAKSAHGPWWLSRSPALSFALPLKYFDSLGLPRLYIQH